jgi:UV damage endonuclease UvdE
MFKQHPRVGFACKIQESHDKAAPGLNTGTTTITWLNNQTRDVAVAKLWGILDKNTNAIIRQLEWVAKKPAQERMFRLSSDLLPAYTHDDWSWWYWEPDVVRELEARFDMIGNLARQHDIRLSFHPGQFCVLASENPNVVENSIQEFEYHVDLIRYMGYGREFQDFKCNVHIGGKQGPEGIKQALKRLSREARNVLTIENAEFSWGINASLELVDHCALVLDIHHHWIMSGEYIEPTDPRVQRLWESWRGVRPVIHYSLSREDVVVEHDRNARPNLQELLTQGFTRAKLRAHSDYYWNLACNEWAGSFLEYSDIMLESKEKNLAQAAFVKQMKI